MHGCDSSIGITNQAIDYFFIKNRIEIFCSRSVLELYDLSQRIKKEAGIDKDYFFSSSESKKIISLKSDIYNIFSSNQKNKESFKNLIKLEKEVLINLKGAPILNSCIDSIQNNLKCKTYSGNKSIECINYAQRQFTLGTILNSKITAFFPAKYLNSIKNEFTSLKKYFQN